MDYLPVFLDLNDRRVLVVGGGSIAAHKVELLLAAHARVRVVAPELQEPLAAHRDAGRIEHLAGRFAPEHLEGAMLVVAATDDPAVNQAVSRAAAARALFVNVVDAPADCSFIMPSIVDRSPVIVAAGTSARSPALARRLRTELESLLPERLGELARLASALRRQVRQKLESATLRQRFWDALFDGSVATRLLAGTWTREQAEAEAQAQLAQAAARAAEPQPLRGEVYLIGAGPGDADLLTLRALQLLQRADVVLYDRLVSQTVLARVRREALKISVGKESGRHRVTQERIHALLLEYAGRGLRVARLKGGDPFVFGRGGEELEVLRRAGVPTTIVPGITAVLGAAAAVGVPLTQRGLAQSVTLVTAMGEGAERLDWRALAQPMQTVVFYMGAAQLPRIVARLIGQGAPADRPALIIERATLADQRTLAGPLERIAALAREAGIGAPALLIVGEVAAQIYRPGTARLTGAEGA